MENNNDEFPVAEEQLDGDASSVAEENGWETVNESNSVESSPEDSNDESSFTEEEIAPDPLTQQVFRDGPHMNDWSSRQYSQPSYTSREMRDLEWQAGPFVAAGSTDRPRTIYHGLEQNLEQFAGFFQERGAQLQGTPASAQISNRDTTWLEALRTSLATVESMHTSLVAPTVEQLVELWHSPRFRDAAQRQIQNTAARVAFLGHRRPLHYETLAHRMMLLLWVVQRWQGGDTFYRLGVVAPTHDGGYEVSVLNPREHYWGRPTITVWVHTDNIVALDSWQVEDGGNAPTESNAWRGFFVPPYEGWDPLQHLNFVQGILSRLPIQATQPGLVECQQLPQQVSSGRTSLGGAKVLIYAVHRLKTEQNPIISVHEGFPEESTTGRVIHSHAPSVDSKVSDVTASPQTLTRVISHHAVRVRERKRRVDAEKSEMTKQSLGG